MKKLALAALFGLIVMAVSNTKASAWGGCPGGCNGSQCPGGFTFNFCGFSVNVGCRGAGYVGCDGCCFGCPTLGPWYLYWPYEAHFNAPAPVPGGGGYPYWPTAQTADFGGGNPGSYAPSYWYGH
jgi:hypothetical protein